MTLTLNDPHERARLAKANWGLLGLFVLVTLGGWAAFGLDFASGALVGCIVVAINFYLSQYLLARLFVSGQARFPVVVFYILKFALAMAVLFAGLFYFQVDLWGVMAGLSTLMIISLLSSFFGTPSEAAEDQQPTE